MRFWGIRTHRLAWSFGTSTTTRPTLSFLYYDNPVVVLELHPAAGKHQIQEEDVPCAVANCSVAAEVDLATARGTLYVGPDRVGNLLEVFVVERDDGVELAIHAMRMRSGYGALMRTSEHRA